MLDTKVVGQIGGDRHEIGGQVLHSGHVNERLEDRQGQVGGRVDRRYPRMIPSAAVTTGALPSNAAVRRFISRQTRIS